jgi:hypothetical protein
MYLSTSPLQKSALSLFINIYAYTNLQRQEYPSAFLYILFYYAKTP